MREGGGEKREEEEKGKVYVDALDLGRRPIRTPSLSPSGCL